MIAHTYACVFIKRCKKHTHTNKQIEANQTPAWWSAGQESGGRQRVRQRAGNKSVCRLSCEGVQSVHDRKDKTISSALYARHGKARQGQYTPGKTRMYARYSAAATLTEGGLEIWVQPPARDGLDDDLRVCLGKRDDLLPDVVAACGVETSTSRHADCASDASNIGRVEGKVVSEACKMRRGDVAMTTSEATRLPWQLATQECVEVGREVCCPREGGGRPTALHDYCRLP